MRTHGQLALQLGLVAFILLVGAGRIAMTYGVLNQTYDEPVHVASGLQWLDAGEYTLWTEHPPLGRLAVALGPYFAGIHYPGPSHRPYWRGYEIGNEILYAQGRYWRNLTLARLGTLPFFVISAFAVWGIGKRVFSEPAALGGVALYSLLPPVLGHAGLATTDMALAAAVGVFFYVALLMVDGPGYRRALMLGLAGGTTFVIKFSAAALLPVILVSVMLCRWLGERRSTSDIATIGRLFRYGTVAVLAAQVPLWIAYGPEIQPYRTPDLRPYEGIDALLGEGSPLSAAAYSLVETPLPWSVIDGVQEALAHIERGQPAYLLGEYYTHGRILFYPLVLAVKSPLPWLILTIAGCALVFRERGLWMRWALIAAGAGVVLVMLPSTINLGVRHVLPVYVLLSPVAGFALVTLWMAASHQPWLRVVAVALTGWLGAVSLLAHPDYIASFNELAGARPERIVTDSDLDWGQDLYRLKDRLEELGINEVNVAYFGTVPASRVWPPGWKSLGAGEPVSGWVAISLKLLYLERAKAIQEARKPPYDWIETHQPVERIGRSILLYRIP
jgi:dolichyl-phosphate-mannose-protein mannosyltransferase